MTAAAVVPMHSVIISFPAEAPDHLLQKAKDAVIAAKGKITHEYSEYPPLTAAGQSSE
ncbi:hypothetical protein DM02DRAFT_608012 [Periconia macrospinosa]|uniref:Uncharacterized protein n=1 Tax=Periconia macrospinosa TaxID=97972 RepID=A0A2V1EEZ2_9PLEO|nr:hypothetical protein DM02DRAFT_608012 [Periconia macrospinosa]